MADRRLEPFSNIVLNEEQLAGLKTPCFVINETRIEENLQTINRVQLEADCKILLAFKGFAMWSLAPLVMKYLPGISASSVNEAILGREEFGGEVHVYSPAYSESEMNMHVRLADHIVFNTPAQWQKYKSLIELNEHISPGLRINPEHSEVETQIYDPCAPFSRLGTTHKNFTKDLDAMQGIEGLHFHNLCELNSDALERTLKVVEESFGFYFDKIKWVNFGGGHHISRSDYDIERLIKIIKEFKARYQLDVYMEPGEAIALNAGILVAEVLDTFNNGMEIAILNTSATTHMPDVLEMPYRPAILNSNEPGKKQFTYRLGGPSCLAGDVIGDYSFDKKLEIGDKLIFGDMAHYSMVKTTTFNGVNLPSIYIYNSEKIDTQLVKHFGYEDFKNRLS
ncbi:MAG: carboxynorspermidine decarboxylase [Bacteroidales bacterium]|nr:carboxynorspermidine decarboxylase [Bacteroidales bacterium]MBN2821026.1 carboxynorspermidine decarboxylase [Bacteroidales bacterium]